MEVTKEQIVQARKLFPGLKDKTDDEVALAFVLGVDITKEFEKKCGKGFGKVLKHD